MRVGFRVRVRVKFRFRMRVRVRIRFRVRVRARVRVRESVRVYVVSGLADQTQTITQDILYRAHVSHTFTYEEIQIFVGGESVKKENGWVVSVFRMFNKHICEYKNEIKKEMRLIACTAYSTNTPLGLVCFHKFTNGFSFFLACP